MTERRIAWYPCGEDARMPYLEVGTAVTPVVVALPGLTDGLMPLSEPRTVRGLTDLPLSDLPFRLVTLSYRHPLPASVTTRDLAEDVAAFVRDVVGAPVAVTGHSMGGMVAQHLAAAHPDLVSDLALTATLATADATFAARLDRWLGLVEQGRWRAFYADALAVSYTGSDLLRRRLVLRLGRAPALAHLVDRHRSLTRACLRHDARPALARIEAPTLVLAGSEDPVVRPALARELAAGIPGAEFDVLDGLAHGFPEQAPDRTYRRIASLLGIDEEVPA
jgi:pimeloyl-ACP methyl ester carboxylesterase